MIIAKFRRTGKNRNAILVSPGQFMTFQQIVDCFHGFFRDSFLRLESEREINGAHDERIGDQVVPLEGLAEKQIRDNREYY